MRAFSEQRAPVPPFLRDLAAIGRHRNVRIIIRLHETPLRFNEVVAGFPGAGEDGINNSLRELDTAGLITRRVEPGPPLRVLYALTSVGERLAPALESLAAWALETERPVLAPARQA